MKSWINPSLDKWTCQDMERCRDRDCSAGERDPLKLSPGRSPKPKDDQNQRMDDIVGEEWWLSSILDRLPP